MQLSSLGLARMLLVLALMLITQIASSANPIVTEHESIEIETSPTDLNCHQDDDHVICRPIEKSSIPGGARYLYKYSPTPKWPGSLIKWYYNPAGQPYWVSTSSMLSMIQASMNRWSSVCGIRFAFQYTTTSAVRLGDGYTMIGWSSELINGKEVMGFETTVISKDLSIGESDILLNPTKVWTTEDIESTLNHEIGHSLGLAHSDVAESIMFANPYHTSQYQMTLRADDISGCQRIYGSAGSAPILGPPPPTPPTYLLTVHTSYPRETAHITSNPAGIDCYQSAGVAVGTCKANFPANTQVRLTTSYRNGLINFEGRYTGLAQQCDSKSSAGDLIICDYTIYMDNNKFYSIYLRYPKFLIKAAENLPVEWVDSVFSLCNFPSKSSAGTYSCNNDFEKEWFAIATEYDGSNFKAKIRFVQPALNDSDDRSRIGSISRFRAGLYPLIRVYAVVPAISGIFCYDYRTQSWGNQTGFEYCPFVTTLRGSAWLGIAGDYYKTSATGFWHNNLKTYYEDYPGTSVTLATVSGSDMIALSGTKVYAINRDRTMNKLIFEIE